MKEGQTKKSRRQGSKKLLEKAGKAMKQDFFLETIFILSELFTNKLAKVSEITETGASHGPLPLDKRISHLIRLSEGGFPEGIPHGIPLELLTEIRSWKNMRNELYRDLPVRKVTSERMKRQALEGIRLYNELNTAFRALRHYAG